MPIPVFSALNHILLADDDKEDCLFFKEALKELSIVTNLTMVHDGEQLMQLLTDASFELPQVLFLDLNMPRKNGFSCLEEIKGDDRLKSLPVIIFSTPCEQDVADQLFDFGAHLYICKPPDFVKLKNVIYQALLRSIIADMPKRAKDNFILNHH